jgi:hypothetical protein
MAPVLPQTDFVIVMLDFVSLALTIAVHLAERFGSYCNPLRLTHRALQPSTEVLNRPTFDIGIHN